MIKEKDAFKLQEHVGNIFTNHYLTKKILFLYGDRDGGKTTFLRILEYFIGDDNCSNLTLDQLGEKFTNAMMYGKRANINGEIHPKMPIKHTAKIKALTGEETITTRFLYGNPFKYHSMAKQFFAANGIPNVNESEVDDAFYSRFDFIEFPKQFTTKENIFEKYTQPNMMSCFLNWALEGLKRLSENEWKITNATPIEESEYLFEHSQYGLTTFDRWLSEEYEASKEGYISEEELWKECKKWHETRKITHKVYLVDKHVFGRKLSANRVIPIQKFHPLDKRTGKQVLSIKGIKQKFAGPEVIIEDDSIFAKDEFRKWGEGVDS
jgi:P4 family phage/plasmid primase-like protien